MKWLEKRIISSKNSERGKTALKKILENSEFKKLSDYDNLVLQLYTIDNDTILDEIKNILLIKDFTKCKTFPLIISDIISMNDTERLYNFRRLINLISGVSNTKFKAYVYLKFLSLNNRKKEDELYILVDQTDIESYDYEKIISSIFRSDDMEWIYQIRLALCDYEYDDKLFDKLIMIKEPKIVQYLKSFIFGSGNELILPYIEDLIKITDEEVLDLLCDAILDEDLKRTQYYTYIINMLFNTPKEKLEPIVYLALDPDMLSLDDYKKLIDFMFSCQDTDKLTHIRDLVSDCDSKYLGKIVNKAIQIDDMEIFKKFSSTIIKFDDEYILKLLDLDFTNEKIKQIIEKINEIFLIVSSGVVLTKSTILNLIFNKILVVQNYDDMLFLLDETIKQVHSYSTELLRENNNIQINKIIDEKMANFDKQLIKK